MRIAEPMRQVRRGWFAIAVATSLLLVGAPGTPYAAGPHPENLRNREILASAYHEPSDTYFQLAKDVVDRTGTGKWAYAVQKARTARYKDREGRLARIDNAKLHQWVVETFDFGELNNGIWIGLRYWCSVRMLTWIDGRTHSAGEFAPWGRPWHRTDIRCGHDDVPYMGVYYEPNLNVWKAAGPNKRFRFYLIEFPSRPSKARQPRK
jgi:hypothetical protein